MSRVFVIMRFLEKDQEEIEKKIGHPEMDWPHECNDGTVVGEFSEMSLKDLYALAEAGIDFIAKHGSRPEFEGCSYVSLGGEVHEIQSDESHAIVVAINEGKDGKPFVEKDAWKNVEKFFKAKATLEKKWGTPSGRNPEKDSVKNKKAKAFTGPSM